MLLGSLIASNLIYLSSPSSLVLLSVDNHMIFELPDGLTIASKIERNYPTIAIEIELIVYIISTENNFEMLYHYLHQRGCYCVSIQKVNCNLIINFLINHNEYELARFQDNT